MQGLKDDKEVEKTTLSETLNTASSTFKFFTVKQIFPRETYCLKVHRDALYVPKPLGDHGFSDNKAPFFLPSFTSDVSRHRRVGSEVRHLRLLSGLYGGFGNRRTLSQGWTLKTSPGEAGHNSRSTSFRGVCRLCGRVELAVASSRCPPEELRLPAPSPFFCADGTVWRKPCGGSRTKGPSNRVRTIRQANQMAGSSVTFAQKHREPKTSTKVMSSKRRLLELQSLTAWGPRPPRLRALRTQEPPFRAGAGRVRPRPFQGSKKSGKASSSTSTRQRWRVPGGGSPGRLCPALAESAGQLPGHRHRRGRGGHCIPATASAHPSKHRFPDQQQPSGPSASSRWLADEGSHRASLQRDETYVMPTFMFRWIRLSASICVSWSTRCTSSLVFSLDWQPIHESSPSCCEPRFAV